MSDERWPQAMLSDTARLRVLAAGLPGVALAERILDAPFDDVWGFVADLERSVPAFDRDVRALRVRRRDGEHLDVVASVGLGPLRLRAPFHVELRPGWCWMVSRPQLYVVGMAAESVGSRTRFVHLEGAARPAPRALRPLLRPLLGASRWRHRRHVEADLDGIERALR